MISGSNPTFDGVTNALPASKLPSGTPLYAGAKFMTFHMLSIAPSVTVSQAALTDAALMIKSSSDAELPVPK